MVEIRDGLWIYDMGGIRDICYRGGECYFYNNDYF